jgi:hypothetical protein
MNMPDADRASTIHHWCSVALSRLCITWLIWPITSPHRALYMTGTMRSPPSTCTRRLVMASCTECPSWRGGSGGVVVVSVEYNLQRALLVGQP